MELQFNQTACRYLRTVVDSTQTKEETQEIRISDGLPDIGRVMGCWGQTIIRGKEWRSDEIRVNGGVMVWVAYAPEDGSGIRCVESWIPVQFRWDLEDSQRDGRICVVPRLCSMDARSTSARKLMIRVNIALCAQALEATDVELYTPGELSKDVQLLQRTYPLELPQEAGEKLFQLEETIKLPPELVRPEKILHYELIPSVTEQKIMANRLVFRGMGTLCMLYTGTDGMLHAYHHEIPYSQYTELDRDYGSAADAWVTPVVTSLELTRSEEDTVALTAGIAAQYVIYDRVMVELTEDAYSNQRSVEPLFAEISLPARLDQRRLEAHLQPVLPDGAQNVAEVRWLADAPDISRSGSVATIRLSGHCQTLYYDSEGNLQSHNGNGETALEIAADEDSRLTALLDQPDGTADDCAILMQIMTCSSVPLRCVCGLQVGEMKHPQENRPSLILCRTEGESLWHVAKTHGSTVEEIRLANGLNEEPQADKILLIPIQ